MMIRAGQLRCGVSTRYVRYLSSAPYMAQREPTQLEPMFADLESGCKWAQTKIEEFEKRRIGTRDAFSLNPSVHRTRGDKNSQIWNNFVERLVAADNTGDVCKLRRIGLQQKRDSLDQNYASSFTRLLLENRVLDSLSRRQNAKIRTQEYLKRAALHEKRVAEKTVSKKQKDSSTLFDQQEGFRAPRRKRDYGQQDVIKIVPPIALKARQSVKALSLSMSVPSSKIIWVASQLLEREITINDFLSRDVAEIVVHEFGCKVLQETSAPTDKTKRTAPPRPPVVCILGHVDHGKTTLLDALRGTTVAEREAGGITQSIGAFAVKNKDGEDTFEATFLDTPGHALFSQMRALGASSTMTDLVVLVIDAIDGLMPQTIESIRLAQKEKLPIVVAINKCDLEGADPDKIIADLERQGVITEDKGGDVLCARISAKKGTGLDILKTAISLTAESRDVSALRDVPARAAVVESRMQQGLGLVVNVIVREGVLRVGDWVVCGHQATKVRVLLDSNGQKVSEAPPAFPVSLIGFKTLENLSGQVQVFPTEQEAMTFAKNVAEHDKADTMAGLDETGEMIQADAETHRVKVSRKFSRNVVAWASEEDREAAKELASRTVQLYLKADVLGSLDALKTYIVQLPQDYLTIEVVREGLGEFTTRDVELAGETNAFLAGFGVEASEAVKGKAKELSVRLSTNRVIYNLMDDIRDYLSEKLPLADVMVVKGTCKVNAIFPLKGKSSEQKVAAGCVVTGGELSATAQYRVLRNKQVVHEGGIDTLKHFKDKVSTVEKGKECGIVLENFHAFEVGDVLECFQKKMERPRFDDSRARGSHSDMPGINTASLHLSRKAAGSG
eukprot:gb/GEZN01002020.1/.p1 GENE.gb/GEZN01002020.1/~~gb/GEZN01002020.1/.p1  ORF type:complete len:843 (-),score=101.02 gb/GEZN01002020.1/:67-2595(-)